MNNPAHTVGDHDPESGAPTRNQIYLGLEWTAAICAEHSNELTLANLAVLEAVKALAGAFAQQSMSGVKQASEALSEAATQAWTAAKAVEVNASVLSRKSAEHLNRRPRP